MCLVFVYKNSKQNKTLARTVKFKINQYKWLNIIIVVANSHTIHGMEIRISKHQQQQELHHTRRRGFGRDFFLNSFPKHATFIL